MTENGSPPAELDPMVMRHVLGHFCTGLTVVTAMSEDGPVGFTCQSFTSVSLSPPLVSLSVAKTSTSWPLVRDADSFCVNVLASHHADVSTAFSRSQSDKFGGLSWRLSGHGAPVLDGVLAHVDARVWTEYDGGDHTIVVASVLDLAVDTSGEPLLFYRGAYGNGWGGS